MCRVFLCDYNSFYYYNKSGTVYIQIFEGRNFVDFTVAWLSRKFFHPQNVTIVTVLSNK